MSSCVLGFVCLSIQELTLEQFYQFLSDMEAAKAALDSL